MRDRLLIGPVLVLAVIGLVWLEDRFGGTTFPPGTLIGAVVVLLVWLGAGELGAMARAKGTLVSDLHLRMCALLGAAISMVDPAAMDARSSAGAVSAGACIVLFGSMVSYARRKSPPGVMAFVGTSLLSFAYLGLMFGYVFAVRREHSAWVLLWVVLTTKACDTGAYFTGRAVGRHKLIPWLSPGKTWEGLVGGAVWAAAVASGGLWLLKRFTGAAPLEPLEGAVFGVAAAIFGQAGDLMASFMKRDAGLKDSGKSIPGMGGILDVIDSPLLVMPVAYWWMRLAG